MVKLTKLSTTVPKGLVVWVISNPALNNLPQIAKIKMPDSITVDKFIRSGEATCQWFKPANY